MADQHVQVEISVDGLKRVAFNTNFGWVGKTSIDIDAVDLAAARKGATDFLKELDCVPFENMCENEEFTDEANDNLGNIIDAIAGIEELKGEGATVGFTCVYPLDITVNLTNTYVVEFGD